MQTNNIKKWELVNFCENDKFAVESYCAIHHIDKSRNLGDINLVNADEIADFNMICGASPCQDFSVAGNQKGSMWKCLDCGYTYNPLTVHYDSRNLCPNCHNFNVEKTRSSLLVELLRIIRAKKPNFGVYENVKNIVSNKFKESFKIFTDELDEYGYNVYYKVLNAKDFGVPQNRERVFVVFIKKELDNGKFEFPQGFESDVKLVDLLESEVDDKYYIGDKMCEQLKWDLVHKEMGKDNPVLHIGKPDSLCINDRGFKERDPQITKDNCPTLRAEAHGNLPKVVMSVNSDNGISRTCKVQYGRTSSANLVRSDSFGASGSATIVKDLDKVKIRIRKLTPKECFRLMDFDDEDYENASSVCSNSQLYKQCGNSIVVSVLYYIYKELYKAMPYLFDDLKLSSFFSGIGAFEKALDRLYDDINNNKLSQAG